MENPPKNNNNYCPFPSQLRYDLISKDWVVIATGRGKRPEAFKQERKLSPITEKDCIFCNIGTLQKPIAVYVGGKLFSGQGIPPDWNIVVIPNKYPAFCPADTMETFKEGKFYQTLSAVGYCEVIVTRDHNKHLPLLETAQIKEIFDVFQARYLTLKKKKFVKYISIFHNHGVEAAASQPHPHSQIITSPLVDVDMKTSVENARKYYIKHKKCANCEMNKWELKQRKRLVYDNADFVVLCPFASKSAFEVIVSPKRHLSYFEEITEPQKNNLADAFKAATSAMHKGLNDPAFNFYHWHWTILPKTSTLAGFEMGTRMEISTIEPEAAAEYLRQMI